MVEVRGEFIILECPHNMDKEARNLVAFKKEDFKQVESFTGNFTVYDRDNPVLGEKVDIPIVDGAMFLLSGEMGPRFTFDSILDIIDAINGTQKLED